MNDKYKKLPNDNLLKLKKSINSRIYFSIGLVIVILIVSVYNMVITKKIDYTFLVGIALLFSNYTEYKNLKLIKKEIKERENK